MKSLRLFTVLALVVTSLAAEAVANENFDYPKPTLAEVNRMNKLYVTCLREYRNNNVDAILMNIIKQKILVPEANYDCFKKPLKSILKFSKDDEIRNYAMVTYIVIMTGKELRIEKEQLYIYDASEFFSFVNNQLPAHLAVNDIN